MRLPDESSPRFARSPVEQPVRAITTQVTALIAVKTRTRLFTRYAPPPKRVAVQTRDFADRTLR
jgi:hypothetical protein